MATSQLLLASLARAYTLVPSRSLDDPELLGALQDVQEAQREGGWMVVRVGKEGLWVKGDRATDVFGEVGTLRAALEEAGIVELRFQEPLEPETWADFLQRLHEASPTEGQHPSGRFRGLEEHLGLSFRGSGEGLPGMAGGVHRLFFPHGPLDSGLSESFTDSEAEPHESPEGFPTPSHLLPPELLEEVETFLSSYDLLRKESEDRIRRGAEGLREARMYPALSQLVSVLADSGESGEPEKEALDLAQDITTPAVASLLVAQLGASESQEERERLIRVIKGTGREGAMALADALEESRERRERRTFLDALVSLGPLAYEVAQRMMKDSRWFVVRNGVTALGELGGEEALSHLTGALGNEHPRVRREAVLALAKLGSRESEALILGVLDDPSPQVRAASARALGALKSQRSVTSLIKLIGDRDADVQTETIRALGQIRDPAAVHAIEKKAMGTLFSRPPREVRIAAFQSLAAIGTPGALRALEKGMDDRDEEVRRAVRSFVG